MNAPFRFYLDDREYLVEDILDQNAYILRYGGNEDE